MGLTKVGKTLATYIPRGSFRANLVTVLTGTTIAQAIPIVASPVLSRIYTPNDFGVYALFISITTIIAVLVTGRYELAIMLPEKDGESVNVLALSIIISAIVCLATLLIVSLLNNQLTNILGNPQISDWLYLVPLTAFLIGVYQTFSYWQNRKRRFKNLSLNRVVQSSVSVGSNLGLGLFHFGASGLIVGNVLARFVTTAFMGWNIWTEDKATVSAIRRDRITHYLVKYKDFPRYSGPADFINAVSNQAPVVLLGIFFGSIIVGNYSFTLSVLAAPISLISASVFEVFKERAASDFREHGNCRDIYVKTFKVLFYAPLIPFVIFFFVAPELFAFVFGAKWRLAGDYARILSVMYFLRLSASPLSYVFYIAGKQAYDLVWQIVLFVLAVCSILIGGYLKSVETGLVCFSLCYSGMYIIYLLTSYRLSKGSGAGI